MDRATFHDVWIVVCSECDQVGMRVSAKSPTFNTAMKVLITWLQLTEWYNLTRTQQGDMWHKSVRVARALLKPDTVLVERAKGCEWRWPTAWHKIGLRRSGHYKHHRPRPVVKGKRCGRKIRSTPEDRMPARFEEHCYLS